MPPATTSSELRLSKQERTNVLLVLEKRKHARTADSRRSSERAEYEPTAAPLVELHPGGAAAGGAGFVVIARNLSTGGIAFLHGAMVPTGTRCTVTLFDSRGVAEAVPGSIVRCHKVAGRIHDLGVKFETPVDVARFLAKAPAPKKASGDGAGQPAEAVERLCDAVLRLRELESAGWPGDRLRAALRDLSDLCNTAMKSIDQPPAA
jgi:hypothetical protein